MHAIQLFLVGIGRQLAVLYHDHHASDTLEQHVHGGVHVFVTLPATGFSAELCDTVEWTSATFILAAARGAGAVRCMTMPGTNAWHQGAHMSAQKRTGTLRVRDALCTLSLECNRDSEARRVKSA